MSWSSPFVIDTSVHQNAYVPLKITYAPNTYVFNASPIRPRNSPQGVVYSVPMELMPHTIANKGETNITLSYKGGRQSQIQVCTEYIHAKFSGNIGISLPVGAVGISFTPRALFDWVGNITTIY